MGAAWVGPPVLCWCMAIVLVQIPQCHVSSSMCVDSPQASIAFTEAKKRFSSAIEPLEEIHQKAVQLAKKTASPEFEDLKALPTARLTEILRVVGRSEMKVVFFGRTSNGKSTVINALLKSKVLPFGPGSTTSSISHLRGAASECSFVKFEGSDETVAVEVCFIHADWAQLLMYDV